MTLRRQIKHDFDEAKNAKGARGANNRWHPYRKSDDAAPPRDYLAEALVRHQARVKAKRLKSGSTGP